MNKNLIGVLVGIGILLLGAIWVSRNPVAQSVTTEATPTTTPTTTPVNPPISAMCGNQPAANTGLKDSQVKELKKEDVKIGSGAEAITGKAVVVNYIGRLANGTKFDASCDRGQPFSFALGTGGVIQGWDQGVVGMKVGGQRRLIIPSSLGYGEQGRGSIPPNAALIFDVELLEVK
jgi:peptidylprolyl isomerase